MSILENFFPSFLPNAALDVRGAGTPGLLLSFLSALAYWDLCLLLATTSEKMQIGCLQGLAPKDQLARCKGGWAQTRGA
jgi:hypothetical protein